MRIGRLAALGGLLLGTLGGGVMVMGQSGGKSLKDAAPDGVLMGTAIMSHHLDDPKLAGLIAREFNCLTGENEFKPSSVQPRPGEFTFEGADKLVAFAQKNGMKVVGHTLVWHNQAPAWLFEDENKKPLPREKALANMKAHIDAVAGHFKGKVIGWDVVNEAISDAPNEYLRDTPARRAIGDDYLVKAFEFAKAADPGAELYYNDYSNENPEKRAKTIRLIRELKAAGCKVDGVGLQCHFMMRYADTTPKILDEAIAEYAKEGVKVMVTELDVDVLPRRQGGAEVSAREQGNQDPYKGGLPRDVADRQAKFYADVFGVLAKHRGTVTRVTFWGTHDGTSWLNSWPTRGRTNHALLWDREMQPKPAYEAVVKALSRP